MSKMDSVKEFLQVAADKAAKFIAFVINKAKELFEKLKKSDRRSIILISVAAVLVIVLFALIINGIAKKDKKDPIESEQPSNIVEITTDAPEADIPVSSSGFYTVSTGDINNLNYRRAPDASAEKIGSFKNGDKLEVIYVYKSDVNSSSSGWGLVEYNGQIGWVSMQYLVK